MTVHMRPYVKDGIELDQIAVEGIRVSGTHGVNASERESGQVFYADVVVHVNTRSAGSGDDLTKTVNYSDLADRAAEVLAGSPFQLIEAVADHIAREVLEFEGVQCVDVTVHKPQAPLHVEFKDVAVTIRRDLRDGGLWADKRIGSSAGFSDDPNDPAGAHAPRDVMDERPAQPAGAIIAMGGNLGEVEPTFREALGELHRVNGVSVKAVSPLVRSTPEGGADQPDYLNAVVAIETALAPRELLAALHGIEMVHGRDRSEPGSARTLDLDIVSFSGVTGEAPDLVLPHPRAHQRPFVILPWVAMQRDAVLEPHGAVADLARAVPQDTVTLVSADWPRVPAPEASASMPAAPTEAAPERSAPEPAASAPEPVASAPEPQSAAGAYSQPSAHSAPASAPEPDVATPYSQPSAHSAPASATSATFEPEPELEPQGAAPGQWAPVADASAPSAPSQVSAPAPGSAPQVPNRTSFGVARQTPPAPESTDSDGSA